MSATRLTAGLAALSATLLSASGLAQPAPAPAPLQPPSGAVGGFGDVNIYPKRVVLDDRTRIAVVGLYNRGSGRSDYQVVVEDKAMTGEGQIVDLADVADPALRARVRPATTMLRWSPRRVALLPNEAQTVRLMARVPPDLPPGEYRSHFVATAVPQGADGGMTVDDAVGRGDGRGIGVRIVPRFGISIPVILRVGQTTLSVTLPEARVETMADGRKAVALTIARSGTRSAFGDITVTAPGAAKPVAVARGIGVYTEIDRRAVMVPLDPATDPRLLARGARLTVTYTDDDASPGTVLARQDIVVP